MLSFFLFFFFFCCFVFFFFFFFSSRRRHTRWTGDWSSDVCSSDLYVRQSAAFSRSGRGNAEQYRRTLAAVRSEERRVGKSVDLGGRRIIKKKKKKKERRKQYKRGKEGKKRNNEIRERVNSRKVSRH